MDFLFGLLTGIFAFVATLAIVVVHVLKINLDLAKDSKANNSHNGASRESGSIRGNCNDLTDISEIRLRQMIQKIIAETMNLPPLSNGHAVSEIALDRRSKINDNRPLTNDGFYQRHRTEHYFEPTIYQDLLATAVLNKIVDKQLNNNQAVSETNIVDRDGDSDDINDNVRQLGSDPNFNIERSSTTSGSSVEPRSDFSYPEMEQILNTNDDKSSELLRNSDRDSVMSDYLASHMIPLPDLNAMATESDEDDYISVTSSAIGDSTWEKNWLFKKKKSTISGSVTANSMGMLVPDPKEDVRAQIGDKTADEVSDLSELSSDTDDSLNSLRSKLDPLNDRLVSKHLIGGQNSKMVLDELIERSSIMSNTLPGNEEPSYTDACNEHVIDAPIRNEAINNNVNQKPNTIEEKGDDPKAVVSSVVVEDPSSITLSASDENSESDGCTGFSAVEFFESTSCTPSVVQILAAMALGPMLAVPSVDQPIAMTVSDFNAFTELKELALAEIKSRSLDLTPRSLDVIPEETGDASNQTENINAKIDSSSEEISSFRKPDEFGLPQLGADKCNQQLLQEISSISPISEVETADSHSSGISSIISEPKQQTPPKLNSDSLLSSTDESAELNAHTNDVEKTLVNKMETISSLTLKVEEELEKSHFNSTKSISSKLRLRENSEANENEDIIKFDGVVSSGTVFSDNDNESSSKTQLPHNDCSTLPNAKTNEINADLEVPTTGNKVDAMISNEQSPVIIPEENLLVPKVESTKSRSKVQNDNFDKTSVVIEDGNEMGHNKISLKEHLAKKQPQDFSDIANNDTGNHSSELLQSSETQKIDTSSEITLQDDLKPNEKQENLKEIISNEESSEIKPPVSSDILNNENVKSKETKPDKCSMPVDYTTSQKPQTHLEDQLCHIEITATPNYTSTSLSSYLDTDGKSTNEDNSSIEKLRIHQEVFLKEQSSETQQEQLEVGLNIQSSKITPEGISEITTNINNPQSKTHDPSSEIKLKNILDSTYNAAHKQIKDYKNNSDLPENDKTISEEQSSETRYQEFLDDTSNETNTQGKINEYSKVLENESSSEKSSETKPKQNENIKPEDFSESIKCIDISKEKSSERKFEQGVIISSDIKISCSNNQNVKLHSCKEKKIYERNLKISEIDANEPSEQLEQKVISKEHPSEIIACGDCNTVDNSEIQNEQKLIPNSTNTANYKEFRNVSEFSDREIEEQLALGAKDEDEKSKINKTNFQAQTEQNKLFSSPQSCEKNLKCYSESTDGLSNAQSKELDEILSNAKENISKEKLTVVNQTISEEPNSQAQNVETDLTSYQQSSEMQLQEMQEEQKKACSQKCSEIKLPEVSNSPSFIKNEQSETENNTFAKLPRNETIFKDCSDHNDIILDKNPLETKLERPKNEMKETNTSDTYARQFKELTSFEESNEINLKRNIQDITNSKNDDQFKTKENTLNETDRKDDENISPGIEPDECEQILNEETSEIKLQDAADSNNNAANELEKSEQIFETQTDQCDTMFNKHCETILNKQFSEIRPQEVPDSLISNAEKSCEAENSTLDDQMPKTSAIALETQNGKSETVLNEQLHDINLKDVVELKNIQANEFDEKEQISKKQPDQNDTISNEKLSDPQEGSSNRVADINLQSKNLDDQSTEPNVTIPETLNINSKIILKIELSAIQLKDIADSSNISANELDKSEQFSKTQHDQIDTVSNEKLSKVRPEEVPRSSNSVANIIPESTNNTLAAHLVEPDQIVPDTQNITSQAILKEKFSEIQLQDVQDSGNIVAEKTGKSGQCSETQPYQNDTVSNEQLSEVNLKDVSGSTNIAANIISEFKNNTLDKPIEIIPEAQNGKSETNLEEVISEIQLQEVAASSNIAANELDKSGKFSKTQTDQNDTVSTEQLSEVKPEEVPGSSNSAANIIPESKNNTLDEHLVVPADTTSEAKSENSETILNAELSELQLQDVADSSNISTELIANTPQCSEPQPDRNDTVSNELSEDVPGSLNSAADIISESKKNILDDHLEEPGETIPEAQNGNSETILKEVISEPQFQDVAASSNITDEEIAKSVQCSKTQPDKNDTVSNEQLSEVKPKEVQRPSNSNANIISESKNKTLDDHLVEPDQIVPDTQNIISETILKEQFSEIQLQDVQDSSKIVANELNKDKQISQTQSDRNDTDSNEQLSEVIPEDIPTSLNSVADVTSESKNNTLDDHVAEPDEIVPDTKNITGETILKEELSEIQLKDIADSSNIEANELNKDKQISQTQSDRNDTDSNDQLSEVIPKDIPTSLNSVADVTTESKNNTLDDHLAEPDEIVLDTKNITSETILKEELSEIQLKDKDKQISQTQSDRNDTDSNEQLSEVIPEDIPTSLNSVADVTSDHLTEPNEIVPDTKNITRETILKEELPEIQLKDMADSSNIEANELNNDKQISQTQSDRNDTHSNEQLSEVIPEDIPTSLNSVADATSESKNNTLDDHLAEPDEKVPDTKNITSETNLKEELSEIQLKDIADSSNIEANELHKNKQISHKQSDRNDTDSNEALSEVIREDIPNSLNSFADVTSESKNNTLDDHLAEQLSEVKPEEVPGSSNSAANIIPESKNNTLDEHLVVPADTTSEAKSENSETILNRELSELQLQDVADSSNISTELIANTPQCSEPQPDRNDTVSNELSEDVPGSFNSAADIISESKKNILDDHLEEPGETIPEAQNGNSETILKEVISEPQFQDVAASSNITDEEIAKSVQCSKTQPDKNDTVSNEQLSEVKPKEVQRPSNSAANIISESKNKTLDDHLVEPDQIVPDTQNIISETILKEQFSEIHLQDVQDSSKIVANELNKDKQISQTQSDRNYEIVPHTKNITGATILKQELSGIQLKDIPDCSNNEACELNKDKQISQTQSDRNDTVSNELSEVKPEHVAGSLNSSPDLISESKTSTLNAHLTEPDEIVPDTQNISSETILKEELPEKQLKDMGDSSKIEANELNKDKQISQSLSHRNDTDSIEQLSELIPVAIPTSLNSIADETSGSKNNTLDHHLAEPDKIISEANNGNRETVLNEEVSEIQLKDIADSSNIEANEFNKDKQISKTQAGRNDTVSNELSEVKREHVPGSLNSSADIISESKINTLDAHLTEPDEIVPKTQNKSSETILKEELSEIQLKDMGDSSKIEANELNKDKQISQTQSDRNNTDSIEQLSEVIPEDIPTSLNSIADEKSESKNSTLDHHLAEPDEKVPDTKNIASETNLKEELSEVQLKNIADSGNIEANELHKNKQISHKQSDRNDTDSNEALSEVIREDIPTSLNSFADVTSESKNNTLDDHLAELDEIVPHTKNITGATILKEELSGIQLKDIPDSSNIEANELHKNKQISQTQSDRNDTDSNEALLEVIPEDVPGSLNRSADIISESKINTLDAHLAEPDEIVPKTQNKSSETILKEELSEIQLKDIPDSSNIEANELNKDKQISQTQSVRNDKDSNEQLSEVIPEDIPTTLNSVADVTSESKKNTLDDHLAETDEIVSDKKKLTSETILKEELSEIQLKDIGDLSNIEANELNKNKLISQKQTDRNNTDSNEQLSEVIPEDFPTSLNSVADLTSESKNNTLDDHLAEHDEIVPDTKNIPSETILKEEICEIQLRDIPDSSNIEANELNKVKQISQTQPDRNDTDSNEQLSEVIPEDIPTSLNSDADATSESKNNTLDVHWAELDELVPDTKNITGETILKEELCEIQLRDTPDSSNIEANELNKDKQVSQKQSDRNDTDFNEALSEVIPEDVPGSLNRTADIISESKINTLDAHLTEPDEIAPKTQNKSSETILKEELSEIQLKDIVDSSNIEANELNEDKQISQTQFVRNDKDSNEQLSEVIAEDIPTTLNSVADVTSESKKNNIEANELNKDKQISQTQSDQNDTVSNAALTEVIREDIPTSLNIVADVTSGSKNNNLDDHLLEPDEIVPGTQNISSETILRDELSEIQFKDIGDSSNVEANEFNKDKQISQTQSDRNDTDSNEQLSEVIPEDIPTSLNSDADATSKTKNNTLDDHLAELDEMILDTNNIVSETILKEEFPEIQLKDIGDSSNIEANEFNKDKQISQTQSDRNDTDSNEQLSEVIPEDIPTSLNSDADATSESKNNTLDVHWAELDELVPDTKNITGETILKEEVCEIQLRDTPDSSNIEANELNKDKQVSQTQSDRNDTVSNELSEVKPEDVPGYLNSSADIISKSKTNTLNALLTEPDKIVPRTQNISSESILKEEISEIQLKDIADSSNIEANELNKDKQISQTQSDQNYTVSNAALTEVIREDIPTSLNIVADITSGSKNNNLDDHLLEPDEIVHGTQNITTETILKEELSEIQLKDIVDSSNIEAYEFNKDKQISKTQAGRNDTVSNELSEVKPEHVPGSFNSSADIISESKINTLDAHLTEPDEIVPKTQNKSSETILKEELSEIQLKDIVDSSNIEANELNKDKQISQTQYDRNNTVSNAAFTEVIREEFPTSLNIVADVTSGSKNNNLDDHLLEPDEIVPGTPNISSETILREELSEIQLKDISDSSNIEANELNKDKQISQTQSDRNDTVSNELSEVKPEDVPGYFNSSADIISKSKTNTLDALLTEPDEIVPATQNISSETILKEELSEIQIKDMGDSSKIKANELNKDKKISQTQSHRNDTVSNEQLSEVIPEDIPTSLNCVADVTSESKNNTLDDYLAELDEIVPHTKNITGETILKEELSEIQLKDIADSSNIEANELNKDKQISQTQSDRNDTVSTELSEVKPEDVPGYLNSSADIISEPKNNTLDTRLTKPDEVVSKTQNGKSETILKEELSEIQLNIEAKELNKDKQILQTQSERGVTDPNEPLSEEIPKEFPTSLNSVADVTFESKKNTLDDQLVEPDEIVPVTKNITSETILKEELSEIQLKDIGDASSIEANDLNKDKQILQTQSERGVTDSNEQLSEVIPEDIPTSLNSVADVNSESKNNTLDDHLAEPGEIVPDTQNITETILKEELSEIQLKEIGVSSNIEANELNKDKLISQSQSDRNDKDSNEALSEVKPEDIPTSLNSSADIISESKINTLDTHLPEPDEIVPDTQNISSETILKEELSEIQLKDIGDSSKIEANELNKDKKISQTQSHRNYTVSNEQLSEVIPEDIPTSLNCVADVTSESKNHTLDDHLAELEEIVPHTKNITGETILKEELSEIQLKDIAGSSNIEANELNKDKQISQTQSDRSYTDSNEQLSEVIPEDIPTSLNSIADKNSESKNNTLDDHLAELDEIVPDTQNISSETILKEELSEIPLKDMADSSNIEANELNKDKQISQTQSVRIDKDSNEQLSEVIPEDIPTSLNSIADVDSESKNNTLDDHLAEPGEIVPDTQNITETILKEKLSEIQLKEIGVSSNIEANELNKDKQISQSQSDRNDKDSNVALYEVKPEDIPTSLNSSADIISESKINTLDTHLQEPDEIVPDTQNISSETILKEELSEIPLKDMADSSNIEANELNKDKQISQTQSVRIDKDSNEQLSEVIPEDIPTSLNSSADIISESKINSLDTHLPEPDEIVPDTQNISSETILKEELSEMPLKGIGNSSNIEANELNKNKQILQTQSDRNDTDSNEQLSEVIPEDIPTSLNSVADKNSESKNNTLDDHLVEPDEIIPQAKCGDRENVLTEELSEILLKDIGSSCNISANELDKTEQFCKTQPDKNDTVSNEHLSEVKPEDVPGSLNNAADIIFESKNNTVVEHLAESDDIVPATQTGNFETTLKDDEIKLQDVPYSSNIAATELDKSEKFFETQPDQTDTVFNEKLSEIKPQHVSNSSGSVADKNSKSKRNTLDDLLAKTDEICTETQIVKRVVEVKNIAANELNKREQFSKAQPDENYTISREPLSKVLPLDQQESFSNKYSSEINPQDMPDSPSIIAYQKSKPKGNPLGELSQKSKEIFLNEKSVEEQNKQSRILSNEQCEVNINSVADHGNNETGEQFKSEKSYNSQPNQSIEPSKELNKIICKDQPSEIIVKCSYDSTTGEALIAPLRSSIKHSGSSTNVELIKNISKDKQSESQHSSLDLTNSYNVYSGRESILSDKTQIKSQMQEVTSEASSENKTDQRPSDNRSEIFSKRQYSEMETNKEISPTLEVKYVKSGLKNYNNNVNDMSKVSNEISENKFDQATDFEKSILKVDEHDNLIEKTTLDIVEDQVSPDDTPTVTRQSTVLEIQDTTNHAKDNYNKTTDSLVPDPNPPPGKINFSKKLQRQCRVIDTTPSFEDVSPQSMPQSKAPSTTNSLADLCQKFIHDKHLLTALENRRRRTLLMHRFLSTLDLPHSTDDSMEKGNNNVHTEELLTDPNPVVCESLTDSDDHDSDHDDCNQLSNDSNPYVCTRTNTFEEFLENGIEEKDILAINPNNNSTTNTTLTSTYPIASTEIYSKINTNATKSNSHKQPVTNMSGYIATTSSNQRPLTNDLLTSAVQKRDTSLESARRYRKQHLNNNQVKVERYTDGNYSHGVNINIDVGVGDINDGVNKDEDDDDVAIFRHFVPGSIAEREYKKWNNAVEMPNNPYAPEALKRRISGSQERFIDLPNISPTKDLNPLDLLNEQKLDADENIKRESDYKRYSRDYYINSSLTTPQLSPARDVSTLENKDNREPTKNTLSSTEKGTEVDLYKAIPAQVVESVTKTLSPLSNEQEANTTSTSDDSDTIKMYDSEKQRETNAAMEDKAVTQKEQPTPDKGDTKEEHFCLAFNRSESCGNVVTPARGSTPIAFKFLQPKRKLLEPNQVLSVDEDDPPTASSPSEKPVIEAEVAKALPSVKALARAFLMTTNTTQPQKLWLKKARTLSQHAKKRPPSPKRSLDPGMLSERTRPEDDVTITSDLSSLETDSSSIGIEISNTSDLTTPAPSSTNDSAVAGNTSPVPVRQGVLKNNIAFFENLKNK